MAYLCIIMETQVQDIRNMTLEELTAFFQGIGEKPYRARQVFEWLWQKSAKSFDEMTNLSKELRDKLSETLVIRPVQLATRQISSDRTIKNAFRLHWAGVCPGRECVPAGAAPRHPASDLPAWLRSRG